MDIYGAAMLDMGYQSGQNDPNWFDVLRPTKLPAFEDQYCHATINVDELDPECALTTLVLHEPRRLKRAEYILNNSFGMLGINSVVIIKKFTKSAL